MIKIEKTEVFGWEAAIRGMRNPMNSWDKSDTIFDGDKWCMGENDLALMRKLAHAGDDHGKFARFINVTVDITSPLYWWKEFDTYKIGTVSNSCSTMYKIYDKEFTLDDFSHEHLLDGGMQALKMTVDTLNVYRDFYNETKNKEVWKKLCWWQLIQLLPSSYNQRRTVQLNYQVLNRIYLARKNHKLDEWHTLCDWIEKLPYFKEIYLELEGEN